MEFEMHVHQLLISPNSCVAPVTPPLWTSETSCSLERRWRIVISMICGILLGRPAWLGVTPADPKPAPSRRAEREVPPEVIKRSLFQWAPPEPADAARLTTARGAAAGLRGAQASEAGRDAWAWLMRPAAQPQEEEHEEGSNLDLE